MVGEIESEQAGGLADVVTLHQQTFRLIYNIMMYVTDSRATSGLVDDVAKITRRIGQFGSAPSDVSGRTVVDYINQMLLMETSYLLQQTSLPIADIAVRLHFSETASLTRFFRRMKGINPSMYRKGR